MNSPLENREVRLRGLHGEAVQDSGDHDGSPPEPNLPQGLDPTGRGCEMQARERFSTRPHAQPARRIPDSRSLHGVIDTCVDTIGHRHPAPAPRAGRGKAGRIHAFGGGSGTAWLSSNPNCASVKLCVTPERFRSLSPPKRASLSGVRPNWAVIDSAGVLVSLTVVQTGGPQKWCGAPGRVMPRETEGPLPKQKIGTAGLGGTSPPLAHRRGSRTNRATASLIGFGWHSFAS
jgi:hypothetical protein